MSQSYALLILRIQLYGEPRARLVKFGFTKREGRACRIISGSPVFQKTPSNPSNGFTALHFREWTTANFVPGGDAPGKRKEKFFPGWLPKRVRGVISGFSAWPAGSSGYKWPQTKSLIISTRSEYAIRLSNIMHTETMHAAGNAQIVTRAERSEESRQPLPASQDSDSQASWDPPTIGCK
jgi:hypothetical protein